MTVEHRVLVVDDEHDMAASCAYFLERAGYQVSTAFSGEQALECMARESYSVVITDLMMPRMSGLALIDEIRKRDPDVEMLVITGFPEVDTAVAAMRMGVLDYITKPFSEDDFLERVEKALAHGRVRAANEGLRERLRKGSGGRRLIYRSKVFAAVISTVERAARTDASVLITGESGTGKELIAHHLHDCSKRAERPFVPVDCTTLAENLIESELFGSVKGAFTGADRNRPGLFHVADKGTLFFDEVGELPLTFQPKLLRAIQERQVRRVGGQSWDDVDVRIVCATNADLEEKVAAGEFRQDLFYRLNVVGIDVPPLRRRPEDIEPMAEYFLAEFGASGGGQQERFSPAALTALRGCRWPGNVRQLRNVIERACALGSGPQVDFDDLSPEVRGEEVVEASNDLDGTFQEMKARRVAAIESAYVESLLRRNNGNVTHSASDAGISRTAFQKLMQRYGIKSADFR